MTAPRASDRIAEAARELFHSQGIRAVGVDEIVAKAGVTKPSLYRSFASKDALAAHFVTAFGASMRERFEEVLAEHPGDPRAGVVAWLKRLGKRAGKEGFRGCGASNAAVEFADPTHPCRIAARDDKAALRARLVELCREMDVEKPKSLADGLLLLMEGALITGQVFGEDGPADAAAKAGAALIAAHEKADKGSALYVRKG